MLRPVIGLMLMMSFSLLRAFAPAGGAVAATQPAGCAAHGDARAEVCGDPLLADDDRWLASVLRERLNGADKASARAMQQQQREFIRARDACVPKPPPPIVPPASDAETAPDAEPSPPPDVGAPARDAANAPPGASVSATGGEPGKSLNPAPAADPAPAETAPQTAPEPPPPNPEPILACLRAAYDERIATLEAPLRRPADLATDAPDAATICAALDTLRAQGRLRLAARHAIVLTAVDDVDEMHPAVKEAHLRRYVSDAAWRQAETSVRWWSHAMGGVEIARGALVPGQSDLWILSSRAGERRDRTVLLFAPSEDGAMAGRLIGRFGGDGAGPFDPVFVRFKGETFLLAGPSTAGEQLNVYALDRSNPVCPSP